VQNRLGGFLWLTNQAELARDPRRIGARVIEYRTPIEYFGSRYGGRRWLA